MYGRKRFSRYPRRKIMRRRRMVRRKKATGIRRIVKRMINRKIETKEISYPMVGGAQLFEQTTYTGAIAQTFSLMPSISQGTGNGSRIGDKISVVSARYKGYVALAQPGANGHHVRVVVFSVKDYNADVMGGNLPAIEMQNFFRSGTQTIGPSGYMGVEGMAPINTNRINVYYDKSHFLGTNVVPVNSTSGQTNGGNSGRPFFKWSCSVKKLLKQWKYDENAVNTNLPLNADLWVAYFVNDAGNAFGSSTTQIATAVTWMDLKYKDA